MCQCCTPYSISVLLAHTGASAARRIVYQSSWRIRVPVLHAVLYISPPGAYGCQCCTPYCISVLLAHTGASAARRIVYQSSWRIRVSVLHLHITAAYYPLHISVNHQQNMSFSCPPRGDMGRGAPPKYAVHPTHHKYN